MPVIGYGLCENYSAISWVECGYYVINGFVITRVLKEHLGDCFFELQINPKTVWITVGITCLLMLAWVAACVALFGTIWVFDIFPMSEMGVALSGGLLMDVNPIFGVVCFALVTPFSICGFFYATGFSPMCCRTPKLAYLTVILVLLLPSLFEIFWRGDGFYVVISFIMRLPIHLIACWSYQKTDNIWTPIFSLGIFNLLTAILGMFLI
jgi:apolipoprotein N-acyltransferase